MEAIRDFENFARDLFMHSTYFFFNRERVVKKPPKMSVLHTKTAVVATSSVFSTDMKKFFKQHADVILKDDRDLLRFLLPKCLEMYTDNHESLIVVMAFIQECVIYLQLNRMCFRYHFTAYKCLVAVFQRLYTKQWMPYKEWKGFKGYVKSLVLKIQTLQDEASRIPSTERRSQHLRSAMEDLLKPECVINIFKNEEFVLNEFEMNMTAEDSQQEGKYQDKEDKDLFNLKPSQDLVKEKVEIFYQRHSKGYVNISDVTSATRHYTPRIYWYGDNTTSEAPHEDVETYVGDQDKIWTGSYEEGIESELENRTDLSDFEMYTSMIFCERAHNYNTFHGKMMERKCKHCGIQCYEYSYTLLQKQIGLASWKF